MEDSVRQAYDLLSPKDQELVNGLIMNLVDKTQSHDRLLRRSRRLIAKSERLDRELQDLRASKNQ